MESKRQCRCCDRTNYQIGVQDMPESTEESRRGLGRGVWDAGAPGEGERRKKTVANEGVTQYYREDAASATKSNW